MKAATLFQALTALRAAYMALPPADPACRPTLEAYARLKAELDAEGLTVPAPVCPLPRFTVGTGPSVSLAEMLMTNADDTDLCLWLRRAVPGDFYNGGGEDCRCVEGA